MKKRILKKANALLAAVLAFFGVSSCEFPTAYGEPYSEYTQITGTVKNEAQQPIQNIQVFRPFWCTDTVYTDANGNFILRTIGEEDNVKLYFHDIDSTDNGSYQNDSADVHITYSGGDGEWNMGIGRGTVNKTLKEKTE